MPISKALSAGLIDGTGAITPANVTVSTNNLTVGSSLYVVANGNVGIGNTSPASQLDIWANVNAGYQSPITFSALNSNSVKRNYAQIQYSVEQNAAGIESGGIQFKVLTSNTMVTVGGLNGASGSQYWSFSTENQERMRITSSGNIGIGTSSPSTKLHVYGTGDPIISVSSANSGQAGQFNAVGNGASSYPGFNLYQGSTGYWSMQMRADTHLYLYRQSGSGNVYIPGGDLAVTGGIIAGGTTYSTATNSISLNNGRIMLTKNDDWGIEMAGANSTRIRFYANNGGQATTVGSIQVDNVTARYYAGSVNLNYQGINFPSTQNASADANTLDDYEEGSWTPVFTADTPPTGVTYQTRLGTYTKIGNLVYVRCTVWLTSKGTGGSGTVFISGLPFSAAGLAGYAYQNLGGLCYPSSGDTFTAIYGAVYDSGSSIITHSAQGATSTIAWSSYGNSSKISFSGSYRIE